MPFLTLNGLTLPVAVGSASGSLVETAATRARLVNHYTGRGSLISQIHMRDTKVPCANFVEVADHFRAYYGL